MWPIMRAIARPTSGPCALVIVLAAVKVRDRGEWRCGQRRRTPAPGWSTAAEVASATDAAHAVRMPRGPGQGLMSAERTADHGQQLADAQVIQQPALDFDHVADGDGREIAAVGFAGRRD